jgi:hypothetical protein
MAGVAQMSFRAGLPSPALVQMRLLVHYSVTCCHVLAQYRSTTATCGSGEQESTASALPFHLFAAYCTTLLQLWQETTAVVVRVIWADAVFSHGTAIGFSHKGFGYYSA